MSTNTQLHINTPGSPSLRMQAQTNPMTHQSLILLLLEQLIQRGVGGFPADLAVVAALLDGPDDVVVLACVAVVEVGQFRDVLHPVVRLLQRGDADGYVVGCAVVLPVLVSEIFLLDVGEELGVEGSQVAGDEGVVAVAVVFDDLAGEGAGVANAGLVHDEVGVDEPGPSFLKDGVEQLQHLPAHQLIVSVYDQEDLMGLTVLQRSLPEVVHGLHLFLIADDLVVVLRDGGLVEEVLGDELAGAVGGAVIDDHDVVVGVVLHDDGADVAEVPALGLVVVGGHHDAEGQLFVAADVVFLLVVGVLCRHLFAGRLDVLLHDAAPADRVQSLLSGDCVGLDADVEDLWGGCFGRWFFEVGVECNQRDFRLSWVGWDGWGVTNAGRAGVVRLVRVVGGVGLISGLI